MASGRFSKQAAPYLTSHYINANNAVGDTTIGGTLSTAPSGIGASQGEANLPGDRFIFSPADALAYQNNNTGNMFTGTYRYVASRNNSASSPAIGHAAFWDLTALGANNIGTGLTDGQYQVTSDEAANIGVAMFAGVYINNFTKGNYWFIQESGKAFCKFRTALTGATPAIGCGVYLAGAGNNNNAADVGAFDVLAGANAGTTFSAANVATAYNAIDGMFTKYVGPAETLPSNNNLSLVDLTLSRASFRW